MNDSIPGTTLNKVVKIKLRALPASTTADSMSQVSLLLPYCFHSSQ